MKIRTIASNSKQNWCNPTTQYKLHFRFTYLHTSLQSKAQLANGTVVKGIHVEVKGTHRMAVHCYGGGDLLNKEWWLIVTVVKTYVEWLS